MAKNLGYGNIKTGDEYVNVASVFGISFTNGNKYNIQIKGDDVLLCESTSKPIGGGFYPPVKPFIYTKDSESLWVKVLNRKSAYFNIAEA